MLSVDHLIRIYLKTAGDCQDLATYHGKRSNDENLDATWSAKIESISRQVTKVIHALTVGNTLSALHYESIRKRPFSYTQSAHWLFSSVLC